MSSETTASDYRKHIKKCEAAIASWEREFNAIAVTSPRTDELQRNIHAVVGTMNQLMGELRRAEKPS